MILRFAFALLSAGALAAAGTPPKLDVVPAPKQVSFEEGAFAIDQYAIVLVSEEATWGTRVAARAVQLGLRERLGIDVSIARISEWKKLGARKAIWVIEPRLMRPPERTIGVEGLAFSPEMVAEGYFIRVDAIETVIHGASDAGSYYGAQTFLQLIRPPRAGSLFHKARGPSVPCLWIADWPTHAVRTVPAEIKMPSEPEAAASFLKLAAHCKFNGFARSALPAGEPLRERLTEAMRFCPIRLVDGAPSLSGETPLARAARAAAEKGLTREALADAGEEAWGPPGHGGLAGARESR